MLVVLLLYTTFPTRRGREYKEVVVNVFDGPPSGLHERANVVHRNSIIGASHMIVDDHNTCMSISKPGQVVDYLPLDVFFNCTQEVGLESVDR